MLTGCKILNKFEMFAESKEIESFFAKFRETEFFSFHFKTLARYQVS
jgi:hypothetical protein